MLCWHLFFSGGESFEGFGENDNSEQVSNSGGIDLVLAPHINSTPNNQWVHNLFFVSFNLKKMPIYLSCYLIWTVTKNTMAARCHDILGLAPAYAVHQLGNFACNLYLKKKTLISLCRIKFQVFYVISSYIFLQYFRKRQKFFEMMFSNCWNYFASNLMKFCLKCELWFVFICLWFIIICSILNLFTAMKRCQTDVGAPWDSKNNFLFRLFFILTSSHFISPHLHFTLIHIIHSFFLTFAPPNIPPDFQSSTTSQFFKYHIFLCTVFEKKGCFSQVSILCFKTCCQYRSWKKVLNDYPTIKKK